MHERFFGMCGGGGGVVVYIHTYTHPHDRYWSPDWSGQIPGVGGGVVNICFLIYNFFSLNIFRIVNTCRWGPSE